MLKVLIHKQQLLVYHTSLKEAERKTESTSTQSSADIETKELESVEVAREFDQDAWQRSLESIKKTNNSLYAVLRMARAGLNGSDDVVILTFQFPFHQKQVNTSKNKQIVEKILSAELGQPIRLKLVVDKDLEIKNVIDNQIVSDDSDDNNVDISGIIDIMGGGEVVNI